MRLLASACLLQALSEVCFTGVALAPLGVAVVVGRGALAAKAVPQLKKQMTASAACLIRDLRFQLWMGAGGSLRQGHTLDGKAFPRHEERIKNPSPRPMPRIGRRPLVSAQRARRKPNLATDEV